MYLYRVYSSDLSMHSRHMPGGCGVGTTYGSCVDVTSRGRFMLTICERRGRTYVLSRYQVRGWESGDVEYLFIVDVWMSYRRACNHVCGMSYPWLSHIPSSDFLVRMDHSA